MTDAEQKAAAAARHAAETISGLREHQIIQALYGLGPAPEVGAAWDRAVAAHPELKAFEDETIAGADRDQVITGVAEYELRSRLRQASTWPLWTGLMVIAAVWILFAAHLIPFWVLLVGAGAGTALFLGANAARLPALREKLPWLAHGTEPRWLLWCSGMEAAAAVHLASLADPGVDAEDLVTLVDEWQGAGLDPQMFAVPAKERVLTAAFSQPSPRVGSEMRLHIMLGLQPAGDSPISLATVAAHGAAPVVPHPGPLPCPGAAVLTDRA